MWATAVKKALVIYESCRKAFFVYKATVTSVASTKFYYSASEICFKQLNYNQIKSFLHTEYRTAKKLSEYIWIKQFEITWNTSATSSHQYSARTRHCDLYLTLKNTLGKADPNHRAQHVSKCRHTNKFFPKKIISASIFKKLEISFHI